MGVAARLSDSIDPEGTLRRAAEQSLGTVWEPIEMGFAAPTSSVATEPPTSGPAEVKTTPVRITNGGVLSGAALTKIKWVKLQIEHPRKAEVVKSPPSTFRQEWIGRGR